MHRLWRASEGELPECSQWHLAPRMLRLCCEPLSSDHTPLGVAHRPEIPTHMLYLQRFVYKPDENRMPDEYSVVEMMQINQGNHIPRCGYLLHSSQTHFCMWHLVKKKKGWVCNSIFALLQKLLKVKCSFFQTISTQEYYGPLKISLNTAPSKSYCEINTVNTQFYCSKWNRSNYKNLSQTSLWCFFLCPYLYTAGWQFYHTGSVTLCFRILIFSSPSTAFKGRDI